MAINNIDLEEMRKQLRYDPVTGLLWWRSTKQGRPRYKSAGSPHVGYVRVTINGVRYLAHRVAWALHYNEQPPEIIDHINRDGSDNRITNLRGATHSENVLNAKTQRGVTWDRTLNRWVARYASKYLGCFHTYEEALNVRLGAEKTKELDSLIRGID